jgi:hypothetical protein
MIKRLFLFLGLALLLLAIAVFPLRYTLQVSPIGETETVGIGWVFAPVVAAWGFASLAINTAKGNKNVEVQGLFLLLLGAGSVYASWMVAHYGSNVYWWIQFALMLTPTVLVATLTVMQAKKAQTLSRLNKVKTQWALFAGMLAVPVVFLSTSAYWWLIVI